MVDPVTASAAIMGSASLANGILGFIGGERANNANMDLAKYQNAWNLEQWHRQNEYNSPVETMKRLVDAGLSPRNMQNSSQYANAGSLSSTAMPEMKNTLSGFSSVFETIGKFGSFIKDLELKDATIDKEKALANKANNESAKAAEDIIDKQRDRGHKWVERQLYYKYNDVKYNYDEKTGKRSLTFGKSYRDPSIINGKPVYFEGLGVSMQQQKAYNEFLTGSLRYLEKEFKQDQQRFRNMTGFDSPKEILPFIIKTLELIFH